VPDISPFEGLVFDEAVAGPLDRVTAPPYDTISDARLREHLAASPFNVVRLDLAEGPDGLGAADDRYVRAGDLLREWESRGVLVRLREPGYHAYRMSFTASGAERTLTGLIAAMTLEDWGGGVIPHERTMPGPLEDRLSLLRATHTHLSAVYGTIEGPCDPLHELLEATTAGPPSSEAADEQGVVHRMWPVPADPAIAGWLSTAPLLIADGHHRYTTALRYRQERDAERGPGPWDRVLTLIVDAAIERPPVLPFHRLQTGGAVDGDGDDEVVRDLDTALTRVSDDATIVARIDRADGPLRYRVRTLTGAPPAVRALHEEILDGRVPDGSLRYVSDPHQADEAVRSGEAVAAYLLPPTTPERIRAVIERGDRLPQKSTYFWPKPRTGMIMMPLDGPPAPSVPAGERAVTTRPPAPAS
jgi:uncharacterized protein (DUF1015 family)